MGTSVCNYSVRQNNISIKRTQESQLKRWFVDQEASKTLSLTPIFKSTPTYNKQRRSKRTLTSNQKLKPVIEMQHQKFYFSYILEN